MNKTTKAGVAPSAGAAQVMEPIAVTLNEAERLSGLSRRTLYRDLGAGKIKAVKRGSATLVMVDSLRAYMAALPPAKFNARLVTKAA